MFKEEGINSHSGNQYKLHGRIIWEMTHILIEVYGEEHFCSEHRKQRLQTQIPKGSSTSQSCECETTGIVANCRGCAPFEGINHFLGSVDCYLDPLLFQEKLEIFVMLQKWIDKTTTTITSCDPNPSKSSGYTVIYVKDAEGEICKPCLGASMAGCVWTWVVMSRDCKIKRWKSWTSQDTEFALKEFRFYSMGSREPVISEVVCWKLWFRKASLAAFGGMNWKGCWWGQGDGLRGCCKNLAWEWRSVWV